MAAVLMLSAAAPAWPLPGTSPRQPAPEGTRAGQGATSQELWSPFFPSSKSPAGDQALAAMAVSSPALPGALLSRVAAPPARPTLPLLLQHPALT